METLIPLAIQLISGAIGGNIVGAILKKLSLGAVGNALAGMVGGILCGQVIDGRLPIEGIASDFLSGGAGGGALMLAMGVVKKLVNK